jgi:hypothetical protein
MRGWAGGREIVKELTRNYLRVVQFFLAQLPIVAYVVGTQFRIPLLCLALEAIRLYRVELE